MRLNKDRARHTFCFRVVHRSCIHVVSVDQDELLIALIASDWQYSSQQALENGFLYDAIFLHVYACAQITQQRLFKFQSLKTYFEQNDGVGLQYSHDDVIGQANICCVLELKTPTFTN